MPCVAVGNATASVAASFAQHTDFVAKPLRDTNPRRAEPHLAWPCAVCVFPWAHTDFAVADTFFAWAGAVFPRAHALFAIAERVRQYAGSYRDPIRADPDVRQRDTVVPDLRGTISPGPGPGRRRCRCQAQGGRQGQAVPARPQPDSARGACRDR